MQINMEADNKKSKHVDEILKTATEICDPIAIHEFLSLAVEVNIEHLNLIEDTLSLKELVHRQHVLSQGAILLGLFNSLHASQVNNL
jgi:hypothetical protein